MPHASSNPRPNFLVIMTDQQQAATLADGHPCQMPNIRRLMAQGVQFTQAYTPYPHCCPARATFFTGLYPSHHGIFNNVTNQTAIHRGLRPGVRLFSESLTAAGYDLAFAGKWHVSAEENPRDRGWRELAVTSPASPASGPFTAEWIRQRKDSDPANRAPGMIARPGWGDFALFNPSPLAREQDTDYTRCLVPALDELPRLAQGDKPWMLYVGFGAPHDAYRAPQSCLDRYNLADIELPPSYTDTMDDKPGVYRRHRQIWAQMPETEARQALLHYYAACTKIDDYVGELLDGLEQSGQADNTVVVFLSDHGDYAGAHGLWLKGVPAFREAYHVPLAIRWPAGLQQPGRTVDAFVTLADFAPTFRELAGVPAAPECSGRSLVPWLVGETPAQWRDCVCTQLNGVELYYTQRTVFTRTHKYVYNGFDEDELYDLARDPHELRNVADDPAYAGVKLDLVRRMWRFGLDEKDDLIFCPYGTVALAPFGPGCLFDSPTDRT